MSIAVKTDTGWQVLGGGEGTPDELPGLGGWADVATVSGAGNKYEFTANDIEWSAFEWTTGTGLVTFSESGLVDVLVVDAGGGVSTRTDLGGNGGGVFRGLEHVEAGPPIAIQVGKSTADHGRTGLWWSEFDSIIGVGEVSGAATNGVPADQPIHGRGLGSRTLGLGQMHAITGTNLGYGGGGGGNFTGQAGYPIPEYDPVYGGGLTPRPNSGGGYGNGYESPRPPTDKPGADGVVIIRVPRGNDKTGVAPGPFVR